MTAPSAEHFFCSAPQWTPPLSGGELATVLNRLRGWTAFDGDALLDDVALALDDVAPAEEVTQEIAQRFLGHLMRLVNIAIAAEAGRDADAAQLIERARTLRTQGVPGDHRRAVGHLRRRGWIVNELLEQLVEARCLEKVA
ncbi:DUF6415 family natural product biosynthesis protein [Streptomyces griseoloalbus]|uniref:DUF6415 family natural product biosynthesis protein n=1 Tax=Streptomyces griseoloalbus TaxID=67303 RepID=UPI001873F6A5